MAHERPEDVFVSTARNLFLARRISSTEFCITTSLQVNGAPTQPAYATCRKTPPQTLPLINHFAFPLKKVIHVSCLTNKSPVKKVVYMCLQDISVHTIADGPLSGDGSISDVSSEEDENEVRDVDYSHLYFLVSILVRAALLCGGPDIPATRKLGGFVGHQNVHFHFPQRTSVKTLIILISIAVNWKAEAMISIVKLH